MVFLGEPVGKPKCKVRLELRAAFGLDSMTRKV